jgi:excisionase family DNA binding protein
MTVTDITKRVRRMLTRKETAEYLAVSEATLDRWAQDGKGPPFLKIGRRGNNAVRYPSDLLDEFIDKHLTHAK